MKIIDFTKNKMWGKVKEISEEIEILESNNSHLIDLDLDEVPDYLPEPVPLLPSTDDIIVPSKPEYFKLGVVQVFLRKKKKFAWQ